MEKDNKQNGTALSLPVLIFLVFLVLKLAGIGQVATWSWLWVTSPLWIGFALGIFLVVAALILGIIASRIK